MRNNPFGIIVFIMKKVIVKVLTYLNTFGNRSQVASSRNVTFGYKSQVFNIQKNRKKIIIGENSFINGELLIYKHGGEISVGKDCFVGEHTKIWSAIKIKIGDRVLISHNVNIHDSNDHPIDPKLRHEHFKNIRFVGHVDNIDIDEKEIIIEDDVWIGFNATILKGVVIGEGAIVSACSVVTKDVPRYAIVVGNPARVIKLVDH